MKAMRMMLGDWVNPLNKAIQGPCRVLNLGDDVALIGNGPKEWIATTAELEEIPITEDFLKKNGFKLFGDNIWQFQERPFYVWYNTKEHELGVEIEANDYMEEVGTKLCLDIYFNSVHELQHALKMFEIEKDIRP